MEEDSKLTKYILSPALSGVYVSKSDLIGVASVCGFALQIQERKRMLKELFALVSGKDDFIMILDAFLSFLDYKKGEYMTIADGYPAAKSISDDFLKKMELFKKEILKAKNEAALVG